MNRVLHLKQHLHCGGTQLTRLGIHIPPFLGEKGASVDQEAMLLTRERVKRSGISTMTESK